MSKSFTRGNRGMRLVKNGRVKFHGVWYYPDERRDKYSGQADDRWILFYGYDLYNDGEYIYPFISPWGTLEHYNLRGDDHVNSYDYSDDPFVGDDRGLRWQIWFPSRDDAISLLGKYKSRASLRYGVMRLTPVLFPGVNDGDVWKIIDWNFRDIYPDYHEVNMHPERFVNTPVFDWLRPDIENCMGAQNEP